ncbi:pyridoxal-phosphate dependent enzyme [Solimonas marina]|uniref:tryptophan synthase n=1 Tax=Solimonas marina TaxID=2714601 RepID=A0A970B6B7_9GAMM|nr:pyridoxal-phosphate dependent enzyme [Solimonas marina]NKF22628.1 pyridoxal-phosphate dependent enzyme [Solimonas marina]
MIMVADVAAASPEGGVFYEDLEKLLLEQIAREPQQLDARLRLAELYYEMRKTDAFLFQARYVHQQIPGGEQSTEWRKIISMGRMIAPRDPLFVDAEIGDRIEFVSARPTAAPSPAAPAHGYTRIGEEERFRKPLAEVAAAYEVIRRDPRFISELDMELIQSAGHPTSLQFAERLSRHVGGARIYLKRDDIGSQPAHLLAAVLGQAMLAKRMGKKTLVSFSPTGRSGVVVASIAARLGLQAIVYMDSEQMQLHAGNVFRMWLAGASVTESGTGEGRKKAVDIRQAAWDHWAAHSADCFLVMGLEAAPHPYPMVTLDFAAVAGRECRRQLYVVNKQVPSLLVARAGDNADAIGLFPPFLKAMSTRLVCVEGSDYLDRATRDQQEQAAGLTLQEQRRAALIMEGMDYPRTTREHAWLKASGRVEYVKGASSSAKRAVYDLSRHEGVIPAIQTAYALGWACDEAAKMSAEQIVVVMMSENVDKNIWEIGKAMGVPL